MSGKFRRMIIIMLISISMILLVSCGTMEVSTNVKVNKDGSSNTVFRLVYDESIKNVVGDGLLQQVLGTETEVNVYSQDNNTIEEVTITTSKINIKDLLKSNALNISNLSYDYGNIIKYDVKRKKGVLKDKYTINIGLTKDLLSDHFYGEYGLNTGKNTWYSLTFNTDLSYFKNKNRYHPGRVMAN